MTLSLDAYNREQVEIVKQVNEILEICAGKGWGKFKGDVVCRMISAYLGKYLLSFGYKIVGPNVFIQNNPIEFDLIIVDSAAIPAQFTSAYKPEDVKGVIEVKRTGIFAKREEIGKTITKIRDNLESAHCRIAAYISIRETLNPVRGDSINYGKETSKILDPIPAFILSDVRSGYIQSGKWQEFIEFVCGE